MIASLHWQLIYHPPGLKEVVPREKVFQVNSSSISLSLMSKVCGISNNRDSLSTFGMQLTSYCFSESVWVSSDQKLKRRFLVSGTGFYVR